jgi:hypothetical protein
MIKLQTKQGQKRTKFPGTERERERREDGLLGFLRRHPSPPRARGRLLSTTSAKAVHRRHPDRTLSAAPLLHPRSADRSGASTSSFPSKLLPDRRPSSHLSSLPTAGHLSPFRPSSFPIGASPNSLP